MMLNLPEVLVFLLQPQVFQGDKSSPLKPTERTTHETKCDRLAYFYEYSQASGQPAQDRVRSPALRRAAKADTETPGSRGQRGGVLTEEPAVWGGRGPSGAVRGCGRQARLRRGWGGRSDGLAPGRREGGSPPARPGTEPPPGRSGRAPTLALPGRHPTRARPWAPRMPRRTSQPGSRPGLSLGAGGGCPHPPAMTLFGSAQCNFRANPKLTH